MALRATPIHRAGNRPRLFLGGDRELVMFSGVLSGALILTAQDLRATIFGMGLWFGSLFVLRRMAKADPQLRDVYLRSLRYRAYYPAQSTPFRRSRRSGWQKTVHHG
jgi:type IV secretory pathway TrbD component